MLQVTSTQLSLRTNVFKSEYQDYFDLASEMIAKKIVMFPDMGDTYKLAHVRMRLAERILKERQTYTDATSIFYLFEIDTPIQETVTRLLSSLFPKNHN